jgi:hypothetical protein
MNKKLNDLLIAKVSESIPKNIKIVEYLVRKLNVSKESAYRRMRGDIPFAFDEIALLALDLDFSADEVIGNNRGDRIFFDLQGDNLFNPEENFLAVFREYYKFTEKIIKSNEKEMILATNRLNLCFLIRHEMLFKLFYYKWIHQSNNVSVNFPFSKVEVPAEILALKENYRQMAQKMNNVTFIIDRNIFLSFVREIQYYYSRKLISDQDLVLIKSELITLINQMDRLMQNGCDEFGASYNFYLSLLDIEANTSWASYDNRSGSFFWIYSVNPAVICNEKINTMHKKWLETLKKYSALITQSNEILQVNFIDKQREDVESITRDLSFYE